ncbi:MAG: hypothetical protein QOD06_2152 [Candidatus Binatota bacterium]|jgi:AcrR family transcriptional regulator|nr:hypothetical protein [Candidatus Binatota bacterium]
MPTSRRRPDLPPRAIGRSPRARQQRARDTRKRIVVSALEAFAERGFEGARTRDIAARAGVNQGLITYHFSSKEDLWKAAVDHIFAVLAESLGGRIRALEEVDPLTRARLVVRHYVRFAAAHPELHRLMVQEGKTDGPRMQWLVDRHVRPLYETSRALVEAAQSEGTLPRIPSLHLHYILIGAAAHLFVMAPECRRLTGEDPMRKDVVETHADAIVSILFGRAGKPEAARPGRPVAARRGTRA